MSITYSPSLLIYHIFHSNFPVDKATDEQNSKKEMTRRSISAETETAEVYGRQVESLRLLLGESCSVL